MSSFRISWLFVAVALCLPGCPPPSASCPTGFTLAADGRCVATPDGGAPGDAGDAGSSLPDVGTGPDGCALLPFFADTDVDGHGDPAAMTYACAAPAGYVASSDDCDDACAACHPGATEVCGTGSDENCDGTTDEMCTCTAGAMQSCGMSAIGACHLGMQTCAAGAWGACTGNVDPTTETCNGVDDDCDGMVDDGVTPMTFYVDADADGHGAMTGATMMGCTMPTGYATTNDDCDDTSAAKHPGAAEICDGADNDCNGTADDSGALMCVMGMAISCTTTCGSSGTGLCSATCSRPTGAACSPPAETCDGIDQNCEGHADEGLGIVGAGVGITSVTGNLSPHIVALTTGFGVLYAPGGGGQLTWQTINATGGSASTSYTLGTDVVPGTAWDFDARFDGTHVLAVYSASSEFRMIGFSPASGGRTLPGTPGTQLILPRGSFTTYGRAQFAAASAGSATIYAELRGGTQYLLRRYVINTSTSTPTIVDQDDVVTDLNIAPAWDVTVTALGEVVVYRNTSDDVVLATVATNGTATARGTVRTAASEPNVQSVALGIRSATALLSTSNPLGIVLGRATPGGLYYVQLTSVTSPAAARSVSLPGSAGPTGYFGYEPRNLHLIAPSPGTTMTSGMFYAVAMDDDAAMGPVGSQLRVWEILGDGVARAPTPITVPSEITAGRGDISVAMSGNSIRIAEQSSTGTIDTRQLGCR